MFYQEIAELECGTFSEEELSRMYSPVCSGEYAVIMFGL